MIYLDADACPVKEQVYRVAARYGVTMGGDGVSQVLSLRLGDLPLDDEIDIRDLPAIAAGVSTR